jgi:N-acetylmuramoyl-L-alanine amidase
MSQEAGRVLRVAAFLLLVLPRPMSAADPGRDAYTAALTREQVVRAVVSDLRATPEVIAELRAVVTSYQGVVRRYPTSGYCDNALWQAAHLSLDAFIRFGDPSDRQTAIRLLHLLASEYPTAKLAARVPAEVALAEASHPGARPAPPTAVSRAVAPDTKVRPAAAKPQTDATSGRGTALVTAVRREVLPEVVRVTIELDGEVAFHDERLNDPPRIFVDLPGARAVPGLLDRTIRFESDADVVRQVRLGRHPNNTTRVVLDGVGVSDYSLYAMYRPYRLVFECARASLSPMVQAPLLAHRIPVDAGQTLPSPLRLDPAVLAAVRESGSPKSRALTEGRASNAPGNTETGTGQAVEAGPKSQTSGLSMARQLGLGVSRIVIDPGHGGHDSGATADGITEAELVLDVALRLEKLLRQVPGVTVILTRRTDDFVPLSERTALANRENADLFLSIHANASPTPDGRGVETYFLNFANNLSAAAVATRENAASGQAMGALPDFVKAIALNNKLNESRDLAGEVQRALVERLRGTNKNIKDLGVKQAPFVVLIGAAMPSVLTEISFITNPQEAKLLRTQAYRQRIAESILNAIRRYQTSLRQVTTVAKQ